MNPIQIHSLGAQIELGSLYDATQGVFSSGFSLWKFEDIEEEQIVKSTPDIKLLISSQEECRKNFGIDAEASLSISLAICKLHGSAKFLDSKSSTNKEARVDITCTKVNQTRSIPMETMMNMKFEKIVLTNCPNATHFVCEVTEGAFGNISMTKRYSDSDEAKQISGKLAGTLKKDLLTAEGEVDINFDDEDSEKSESFEIKVDGAIEEPVGTLEDAAKIGRSLPQTLKETNNTMTIKLLPISLLDPTVEKIVRELDETLIRNVSTTLEEAN